MRILIAPYRKESLTNPGWPVNLPGHDVDAVVIRSSGAGGGYSVERQQLEGSTQTTINVPDHRTYGDRRKLVYQYAVEHGYTILVETASCGQGLTEAIGRFCEAHEKEQLQALFGVVSGSLTKQCFAWRILAVDALKKLPFEFNIWGYGFDMEVAQQLEAGNLSLRVESVPKSEAAAPEHFGLGYVWAQFTPWLRSRLHRVGIIYQLQYDLRPTQQEYTLKMGYASSHEMALDTIEPNTTVVDLGAGVQCYLAPSLKEKNCKIYAADIRPITSDLVEEHYQLDLNVDSLPACCHKADHVLLLDIIEHLHDPEQFLLQLRKEVNADRATVVITTPNIAFGITRLMLLIGQFNYGKSGILDRTHCRLFTFRSMRRILRQCGFRVVQFDGVPAPFPKAIGDNAVARLLVTLNQIGIKLCKSLFAYQIFVVIRADAPLSSILTEHGILDPSVATGSQDAPPSSAQDPVTTPRST